MFDKEKYRCAAGPLGVWKPPRPCNYWILLFNWGTQAQNQPQAMEKGYGWIEVQRGVDLYKKWLMDLN